MNVNARLEMQYLIFGDLEISKLTLDLLENRKTINKFNEFFNTVNETPADTISNSGISIDEFHSIEAMIVNDLRESFIKEPVINLTFDYTTPKAKKTTWVRYKFSVDDIINIIEDTDEREKKAAFAKAERSKMNQSLRYDVLKRDHFRCVICGRSADDGVILHVDHIIPVSKGGKTEIGNLRTLCEDCNLGKKALHAVACIEKEIV